MRAQADASLRAIMDNVRCEINRRARSNSSNASRTSAFCSQQSRSHSMCTARAFTLSRRGSRFQHSRSPNVRSRFQQSRSPRSAHARRGANPAVGHRVAGQNGAARCHLQESQGRSAPGFTLKSQNCRERSRNWESSCMGGERGMYAWLRNSRSTFRERGTVARVR